MLKGLSTGGLAFLSVMFHVRLCGLRSMVGGVVQMPLCGMRVMGGELVVSRFMVLRGFAMMSSRLFVVFSCRLMMLRCLFRHFLLLIRKAIGLNQRRILHLSSLRRDKMSVNTERPASAHALLS